MEPLRRMVAGIVTGTVVAGVVAPAAGCGGDHPSAPDAPELVSVSSTAFGRGGAIPARYTCDGSKVSPPLSWSGGPSGTRAWAVVVDDPDAPHGTFVHWVVLDLPASVRSVAEGAVPTSGVEALNSAGGAAYFPPCPPEGTHHYRFTVYALAAPTGLDDGAALDRALAAVGDHALGRGSLTATYTR
jgi:Raf kinase inhibitor-like YbhB/YbcL family protein